MCEKQAKLVFLAGLNRKETQQIGRTEAVLGPDGKGREDEFYTSCDGYSHIKGLWSE